MSNNVKQQGKSSANSAVFQQGLRNLKKRDFKQALKDARVCYRQSPIEEHRKLLEQASVGRAQELKQASLNPQAQDILQELLTQPIIDTEVRQVLPELLSQLGMLERYPEYRQRLDADPELKAKLLLRAADSAVLHPNDAKNAAPEIRQGAALVLAALEKLDAGLESESLELLKDIPRQSPFADWRLFARGMAAYHRNDQSNAEANFSRLDPERIPARLARLLQAIRESETDAPKDPNLANAVAALEAELWGAPLLTDFRFLKARAAAGDWLKVVTILRSMRDRLRVVDPVASQAITAFLVNQAVTSGDKELLRELALHADPLPWDPNWNHARAKLIEATDDHDVQDLLSAWSKYISDLDQVRCWTQDEIRLAKAIALEKVGLIYLALTEDALEYKAEREQEKLPEPKPLSDVEAEELDWEYDLDLVPISYFEKKSREAFNASLALRPDLREVHNGLCILFERTQQNDQAAQAWGNLLKQFPDDLQALDRLGIYHDFRHEFTQSLAYVMQMRQLKPLDEGYRRRSWMVQMNLYQQNLMQKDIQSALKYLEDAEPLNATVDQKYLWFARRAIIEREKGNAEGYESFLKQSELAVGHPAPVWFVMTAESAFSGCPSKLYQTYEKRFLDALGGPFDPNAAGWITDFANSIINNRLKYTGQVKHFKAISDYLKQGKKSKFDLHALREVCEFLFAQREKGNKQLLEFYLKQGRGRFRQAGFFSACLGMVEFQLGPKKCDRDFVEEMLEDAQSKLLNSDDPDDKLLLPNVQKTLAFLEEFDDMDDFDDENDMGFEEDLFAEIGQDEFSRMVRQELDRQVARRTKPGKTVADLSEKEFVRIMSPAVVNEICGILSDKLGIDEEQILKMFMRTTFSGMPGD